MRRLTGKCTQMMKCIECTMCRRYQLLGDTQQRCVFCKNGNQSHRRWNNRGAAVHGWSTAGRIRRPAGLLEKAPQCVPTFVHISKTISLYTDVFHVFHASHKTLKVSADPTFRIQTSSLKSEALSPSGGWSYQEKWPCSPAGGSQTLLMSSPPGQHSRRHRRLL